MPKLLMKEVEKLKKMVLALSARVEENVQKAARSISEVDAELANAVIESDRQIDLTEVEVEEECLKILALHQPVAIDLRFIIAVLKLNNDLERIGDLAVNIAEQAVRLSKLDRVDMLFDVPSEAQKAQAMLRKSLDALVNMDPALARQVCIADEEVDEINREMYARVTDAIRKNPQRPECPLIMLSVSRNLERVADHATNIAEDVIYMTTGEIHRHKMGHIDNPAGPTARP